jgi:hypothetical protein
MAEHEYGVRFTGQTAPLDAAISRVSRNVTGLTKNLKSSFSGFGKMGIGTLLNPMLLASAALGAGVIAAVKRISDLEDHLTRMRIETGMTLDETMAFKNSLYNTALATGVSTDNLVEMSQATAKATHDFQFMNQELGFMAKLQQASGIEGAELGKAMGELHERTGLAGADFETLVKHLYAFGQVKGTRMTLKDVLPQVPELVTTARSLYGKNASIAQIGDVVTTQMFLGAGVKLNRALIKSLSKAGGPANQFLAPLGLNFEKELAKGTKVSDLLLKIMNGIKGTPAEKTREMSRLLGMKAGTGIDKLNELGEALKKIQENKLDADATLQAETFSSSMNKLATAGTMIADKSLSEGMKEISKALTQMDPATIEGLTQAFTGLGKAIGFAAKWGAIFVASMADLFTGKQEEIARNNKAKQEQLAAIGTEFQEAARLKREGKAQEAETVLESAKAAYQEMLHPTIASKKAEEATKRIYTLTSTGATSEPKVQQTAITMDLSPDAKKLLEPAKVITSTAPTGTQQKVGTGSPYNFSFEQ